MPVLSRADTSIVGRWWWSIDRVMLTALILLVGIGYVLALAATPATNLSLLDPRTMVMIKQIIYLALGAILMLATSMLDLKQVKLAALGVGIVFLILTGFTLVHGVVIDGGRRWIALPGFTIQPSEFLKPALIIATAWLLAERRRTPGFPGRIAACAINALVLLILMKQPDVGSTALVAVTFFIQMFLDGLSVYLVGVAALGFGAAAVAAFELIAHVHNRVMMFWHPTKGKAYQAITALSAFGNGGLWGRGPGEGQVKHYLPDARADFVFAVAGEEFGLIVCLGIIMIFAVIVLRGLTRIMRETDLFVALAGSGLLASFGLQAFINMASSLSLIPTKGMTLPFISYGGSAVLAVGLQMGFLLALTRKRSHAEHIDGRHTARTMQDRMA